MQLSSSPSISSPVQHLRRHQSLHLYVSRGSRLQVLQGQAQLVQSAWIAERMITQEISLAAGQEYLAEHTAWVCLTSQADLSFTVIEPVSLLHTWRQALAQRWPLFRKAHHAP